MAFVALASILCVSKRVVKRVLTMFGKMTFCSSKIVLLLWLLMNATAPIQAQTEVKEEHREDIKVSCREHDAAVLVGSYLKSSGKLYFLEESKGTWSLMQTIDLAEYLDGWYLLYTSMEEKIRGGFEARQAVGFNDRWLIVPTYKVANESDDVPENYVGKTIERILIFRKTSKRWKYHTTLKTTSTQAMRSSSFALTDFDQLIVSDPYFESPNGTGIVRCYDLSIDPPRLVQELLPTLERSKRISYGAKIGIKGKSLLISSLQLMPEDVPNDWLRSSQLDFDLYKYSNDRWSFCKSLLAETSEEAYNAQRGLPLDNVVKKNISDSEILLESNYLTWPDDEEQPVNVRAWLQYSVTENDVTFKSWDQKKNPKDVRLVVKKPGEFSLAWQGKYESFGIGKPTNRDVVFAEPDWIVDDANLKTRKAITNYYINDFNTDYAKSHGLNNFYDYTQYIPVVDYALQGNTLITSYLFKDCYFADNPMQKEEVWAGVNVYRLDLNNPPKRVFSLTTRNLKELKEAPVSEE